VRKQIRMTREWSTYMVPETPTDMYEYYDEEEDDAIELPVCNGVTG